MKQQDWLFPNKVRKAGWLMIVVLLCMFFTLRTERIQEHYFTDQSWSATVLNVFIIGFAIGLILIAFSREKQEDEMIQKIRLQALQWSIYVNYLVLILCSLLFYWGDFFNVLVLNMYTVLLVFIVIFRWTLHQMSKGSMS